MYQGSHLLLTLKRLWLREGTERETGERYIYVNIIVLGSRVSKTPFPESLFSICGNSERLYRRKKLSLLGKRKCQLTPRNVLQWVEKGIPPVETSYLKLLSNRVTTNNSPNGVLRRTSSLTILVLRVDSLSAVPDGLFRPWRPL